MFWFIAVLECFGLAFFEEFTQMMLKQIQEILVFLHFCNYNSNAFCEDEFYRITLLVARNLRGSGHTSFSYIYIYIYIYMHLCIFVQGRYDNPRRVN